MNPPASTRRLALSLALDGLVLLLCTASATATPAETDHLEEARRHHVAGERLEALEHYRAYLARPGGQVPERAAALNNLCLVLHDLGRNHEALDACSQALELRRQASDDERLARTLNNHGLVLQALGRWPDARRSYGEALASNRRRGDDASVAVNLSNLGWLASLEGRYGEALELHRQVEMLARHHAGAAWAEQQSAVARINRGVVLERIGAFDEALELYRGLLDERDRLGPRRWATVQVNLGTVYRNLGDPNLAAQAYRRAAAIFEQESDPAALSNALLNVGQVLHQNLGELEEAEAAYLEALRLAREIQDRGEEIQDLLLLGELYLDTGRLDEAQRRFARGLELAEQTGSAEGAWSAVYGLGRIEALAGREQTALGHFEAAIAVIERTRTGLDDRRLRGDFFASWRHVYERAVEVSWRLHQQEHGGPQSEAGMESARRALALVQRAKQRELVEVLGGRAIETVSLDAAGWHDELLRRLGDAALIEYFAAGQSLFAWSIESRSIEKGHIEPATAGDPLLTWFRVGEARQLEQRAAEVHGALASGQVPSGLGELAGRLLPRRPGTTPPERLIIAPDGVLRYLPFEVLPVAADEASPDQVPSRLLEHSVISYVPSASALLRRPDERPRALGLVGLADPKLLPADAPSGAELASWTRRFALGPLDAGRRELEKAAAKLGGEQRLFFGAQATARALREAGRDGSRVVHLAAHTMIDERPGGAALLLAADGGHDGLLAPEDLATFELHADLTVLAACRTAHAGQGRGSGFGSLTGAFLAAGSRGVLATLWDVDDAATEVFMDQLYHQLARGLAPAQALAETKRRFTADERWRAPHLWSAYVLIGDPPPVADASDASPRRRHLAIVCGLLVLACLVLVLARRQS